MRGAFPLSFSSYCCPSFAAATLLSIGCHPDQQVFIGKQSELKCRKHGIVLENCVIHFRIANGHQGVICH